MLLTSVVNLVQDEIGEVANTSASNGIVGGFLYVVATMAVVIFIGSWLVSSKE
jgi:hypothetical protein